MKLIYGDVVEMPRIFGCTAAQSELLARLSELLDIQKFWANVKYVHPGQCLQAEKEDVFFRQTAALNQVQGLCCV